MLSQSPVLRIASTVFGTTFIGFGLNAILRPENALSFFELDYPTTVAEQSLVDKLLIVYGARDVFMGLVIYITAYYGSRQPLGWTLLAASGVAYVDGVVCWVNGHGEWNHWGYAPMLSVVGLLLLGSLGFTGSTVEGRNGRGSRTRGSA